MPGNILPLQWLLLNMAISAMSVLLTACITYVVWAIFTDYGVHAPPRWWRRWCRHVNQLCDGRHRREWGRS
jgi:hypothetical protein